MSGDILVLFTKGYAKHIKVNHPNTREDKAPITFLQFVTIVTPIFCLSTDCSWKHHKLLKMSSSQWNFYSDWPFSNCFHIENKPVLLWLSLKETKDFMHRFLNYYFSYKWQPTSCYCGKSIKDMGVTLVVLNAVASANVRHFVCTRTNVSQKCFTHIKSLWKITAVGI